jgi:hypothetical protein
MKKLTLEEIQKKVKYHEKRVKYYEKKEEEVKNKTCRVGFKWYD